MVCNTGLANFLYDTTTLLQFALFRQSLLTIKLENKLLEFLHRVVRITLVVMSLGVHFVSSTIRLHG